MGPNPFDTNTKPFSHKWTTDEFHLLYKGISVKIGKIPLAMAESIVVACNEAYHNGAEDGMKYLYKRQSYRKRPRTEPPLPNPHCGRLHCYIKGEHIHKRPPRP